MEIWFTTNKKQGLAVKLDDRLEEGKGDIWDTITVFAKRFFEPTSKLLWSSTSLKLSVNATWASFRKSVWNEFRMVTFPFENRNLIVNHWDEFVCIYLHNPKNHFDYIGTNLCIVYSYINVKSFINALLAISFICIIKGWRFLRESLCNQIT